ncbi:MAG: tetratricopeptide repeat protein [Gammaproteobacteria bacterium]|nr:tetratricopeptide repeat protein [Gammaproteobacteria bacterium]MBU1507813.1 tetratricopeptide repeat protein [Gammaproteobacteria bacterium]MBU2120544.1 tetratricopeptide repeat protein [Gammaproteobacteria bacterium]MBU2171236.1 tetratricopeptide repeat protein [Gammaproteobacteria bacterium]MBU2199172.1 tetratricopeptide repeat protein [Gammaproteobacteria bacterium]
MATEKEQSAPPPVLALIVDSNATSRSILVGQLREYGVTRIVQCTRVQDARNRLEHTVFDYVLCEQYFGEGGYSGQTLLDDLRRAQLLPFSTVFFMVTSEASYAAVAEAAESALDGYLLKPFTPSALFERLSLARLRKIHLRPIFDAIEAEDFERAASLCVERFESRQPYWLYAARIGSELLLRLGRHDEARTLFEAVIAARALPWAKLGVARAQIESGQAARAITTLQELIGEDPSFADAYDVLGRAQVELGNFSQAIETYRTASSLTPDSVVRLQKLGMMSYYMGDRETATKILARAAVLGIDSKLFDFQSLVLLTFSYFAENDRKGIERCMADFARIMERHHASPRVQRFSDVARVLQLIQQRQFSQAVESIRAMAGEITSSSFDFEAACNLGGLLAVLAATSIDLSEGETWIRALGLRYANTRGLTELLANACNLHEPYAAVVRDCLQHINKTAEAAMAQSLSGDPAGAVRKLLREAERTLNSKLVDMSQQVLLRHSARMETADALQDDIDALRPRVGSAPARAILGQDNERRPGGVVLRVRGAADGPARIPAPPQDSLATLGDPRDSRDIPDPAAQLRLRPL